MDKEVVFLKGGNSSEVFSDGKYVYRDIKPQSATVHRLLKHLENKKCDFSPVFYGVKEEKEILSFVSGKTLDNYPEEVTLHGKRQIIQSAAKLLRNYHDAIADFIFLDEDVYFLDYNGNLPKEIICHNDFSPYNVTFEGTQAAGIIDFDTICPAPKVWDIAYALYRFVPLNKEVYDQGTKKYRAYRREDAQEYKQCIKAFLTAYNYTQSINLLDVVVERLEALIHLFDEECEKGNETFLRMKEQGHQDFYKEEVAFIQLNQKDWID